MCLAIPGQIIQIVDAEQQIGEADVSGITRTIHLGLLESDQVQVGKWVLIHAGMAVRTMDAEEASRVLQLIDELEHYSEEAQT